MENVMKWERLGRIFDPTQHRLPRGCKEFAKAPQALLLDDRVRVYFTTVERDAVGKLLSLVAFVDFETDMRSIIQVSREPAVELGGLGCFDEHGIFPMNVVRIGDGTIYGYVTGLNRKISVSTDAAIGLVVSTDNGVTFHRRYGAGPVLSASLHEPFLVADAFVKHVDGRFHMWYIHGTRWIRPDPGAAPDRVYKIAHATSEDGIRWVREGRRIVADRLNGEECQALPTVFHRDDAWHMVFCYRQAHGFRSEAHNAYRLGYARSTDLVNWQRDDGRTGIDVSDSGWDSQMQCYPHAFQLGDETYLLYNGNEFGRHGFGLARLVSC
jgi:hypothetical protein